VFDVVSKVSIFVLLSPQGLVRYSKPFNNRYRSELRVSRLFRFVSYKTTEL